MKHSRKKLLNQIAAAHFRAMPVTITHSYVQPITLKSEVIEPELPSEIVPVAYREKELAYKLADELIKSNLIRYRHTYDWHRGGRIYTAFLKVFPLEEYYNNGRKE